MTTTPDSPTQSCRVTDGLPHRRRPCAECPWRRDVAPGKFGRDRYDDLAATSGRPGQEARIDAPMFACHKTAEGKEQACAGWLAVAGIEHIGVRLAIAQGRLDPATLSPGEGWPELFDSFEEMADTQAAPATAPDASCRPRHDEGDDR